ncbi:hypothetical protein [Sphingomonas oligophenolica]|uniref:Uncharacterized protein n=1 Tax=Sphingomonas oligophenolica TaxID=301154 RepID=A0A502BZP7_9SPHN|nr:hypothetical protein [Sphingomonas oligophenolica]TPG06367.1 hypothetical protein EAH84_14940 [Sphingomonas oligophenolica]
MAAMVPVARLGWDGRRWTGARGGGAAIVGKAKGGAKAKAKAGATSQGKADSEAQSRTESQAGAMRARLRKIHPAKRMRTRGSGAGKEVTFDRAPTSKGKKLYDYTMSFNSEVGDRTLTVKNTSGSRGKSSDHRQNSATLTTRKRKIDD